MKRTTTATKFDANSQKKRNVDTNSIVQLVVRKNEKDSWNPLQRPLSVMQQNVQHILYKITPDCLFGIKIFNHEDEVMFCEVLVDGKESMTEDCTDEADHFIYPSKHTIIEGYKRSNKLFPFKFAKTPIAKSGKDYKHDLTDNLGKIKIDLYAMEFWTEGESNRSTPTTSKLDITQPLAVKEQLTKLCGVVTAVSTPKPVQTHAQTSKWLYVQPKVPRHSIIITYRDDIGMLFELK
jgi:hypothetical protein